VAAPDNPVVIVVGSDALALGTARELCALQGHHVVLLWPGDAEFGRAVEEVGAVFIAGRPDTIETLGRAGVAQAITILALSPDDQLNLHVSLLARDANPAIRIVLRQFNRRLARKIEQNLTNSSVLSLAWHSAATYAAAAIDPACFRGLQFPEPDGPLAGLASRNAEACGAAGLTVAQAEAMLSARILAVDGTVAPGRGDIIGRRAELAIFATLGNLQKSGPRPPVPPRSRLARVLQWRRGRPGLPQPNPFLVRLALAVLAVFVLGAIYFHAVFGDTWLDAAYFVIATMTTTGYGDVTPNRGDPFEVAVAIVLMLTGVTLTGLFIAFGASLLVRVQWVTMQGLRPVRRRGHIILCGAGSIGTGVIELLLGLGKRLVVIEQAPDSAVVELARERRFDLLTGDASRDETLDLCNLGSAHSLVALTNVDTLNLEIALGARARNPTMPVVLRIAEAEFAASIARHFEFETTFSVAALAAPAFVGLSRFAGSRGRVAIAGQEFALGEFAVGKDAPPSLPTDTIILAAARQDDFRLADHDTELRTGDRVLIMVPLAPFRAGEDSFAAAADRFLRSG
jgi:voltage-gated potassium channel Kch